MAEFDFRSLDETREHISLRTQNALMRGGMRTVEDLMMADSEKLLRCKGVGPLGVAEIAAWRSALMQSDAVMYQNCLDAVVCAMQATGSVLTERQAVAAMRAIWKQIALSPFTITQVRKMLMPPS